MIKKIIYTCLSICLLEQCANPVSPTGGDKDTQAPRITKITFDTLLSDKKVIIQFDENIVVGNDIQLNPQKPKEKKPIIEKTHKSISIFFKNYHTNIILGNNIKDLNEGNPGKYRNITLASSDSFEFHIPTNLPKFLQDKKENLEIQYLKDTLIYKGYLQKDTFHLEGLPEKHYPLISFIDENKNDLKDSSEWSKIIKTSADTQLFLYPPLKAKVYVDTTKNLTCAIIPFYAINQTFPEKHVFRLVNDTVIGINSLLMEWINKNSNLNVNYKEFKSKPLLYLKKIENAKDTSNEITYSSQVFQRAWHLNTDSLKLIKDTIKTKSKTGKLIIQKPKELTNVQILITKNTSLIKSWEMTQSTDSLIIDNGEYHISIYKDLNHNLILDQSKDHEDQIIHYFDAVTIKNSLDNVINIGTVVKKESINGGKAPSEFSPAINFKKGVK